MIASFADKRTLAVWQGRPAKGVNPAVAERAFYKLHILHKATGLADLRTPPANRLEALKGNLKDFYSIRVNDQYRILFRFDGKDAHDVEITDYHA